MIDLVREALNRERIQRHYDIASNTACAELAQLGVNALDAIESVLINEVAPTLPQKESRNEPHTDLSGVFVVYIKICKESSLNRSVKFLRTLSGRLLEEALMAIWTNWIALPPCESFPELIYDEISRIAQEDSGIAGKRAKRILRDYEIFRPRHNKK